MKQTKQSKKLAKRYKDLRMDYDINRTFTQQELANELGFTKTQISDLERGKKGITINLLKKYSSFFQVTTEYLLGLSDNKHYNTYNIGSVLGLSDNAIKKLNYYHTNNNEKEFNYMQLINFLIENINSDELERIDRYLFAKPTYFLIRDEIKDDYKNEHYVAICSELGEYEFHLKDMQKLLFLDMQELLSSLQNKANEFERDREVKFIDTKDLNRLVKVKGESKNGKHSTKKKQGR